MITEIFSLLGAGLSLWASKEKNKYRDRLTDLERRWREENAKPDAQRSDAVLDNIEFELKLLAKGFAGSVAEGSK